MILAMLASLQASVSPPTQPEVPPCQLAGVTKTVTRKAELPSDVREVIELTFRTSNGLAEAGGYYNRYDVRERGVPNHRFIRAYLLRDHWFIWFEQGGFVSNNRMGAIGRRPGRPEWVWLPGSSFVGDLCAGIRAFLAGARTMG